jgi:hypothetical protein
MRGWLQGRTSPEMLYLEAKWASLIPFAKVADLLQEVLPVEDSVNAETVRNHLHATAERLERELGEERAGHLFEGSEHRYSYSGVPFPSLSQSGRVEALALQATASASAPPVS